MERSPSPDPQTPIPEFLDLISARTEFYEHPTALPTVERGSIKLDLHRRDFTINTLALRLDGITTVNCTITGAAWPISNAAIVRVLHSLSFVDDPTRMLRAVRYEQRYGFEIESRTRQLMDEARPMLEKLSSERVRHELDLILDEPNWFEMLTRLAELGLLKAIHPELLPPVLQLSLQRKTNSLLTGPPARSRQTGRWPGCYGCLPLIRLFSLACSTLPAADVLPQAPSYH